ncbi:MAG: rod shape-determining protein MreC, partial [Tannerella sp.]|nr:rod shape-determining protein MreC [Tannerella sp.]
MSSANTVAGYVSSISGSAISYMNLHEQNKTLFERNGLLELEILGLQQRIEIMKAEQFSYYSIVTQPDTAGF